VTGVQTCALPISRYAVATGTIPEDRGPQLHRSWYNVLSLGCVPMSSVYGTSSSSCELYGQSVKTSGKVRLYADQPVSQVVCQVSRQEVTNGTCRITTVRKGGVARQQVRLKMATVSLFTHSR
jgi:hypothetical protein